MSKKKKSRDASRESIGSRLTSGLDVETKKHILAVVLFAAALVSALSLFGIAGDAGNFLQYLFGLGAGWASFLFPILFFYAALLLLFPDRFGLRGMNYFGLILLLLSFVGLLHLLLPAEEAVSAVSQGKGGGYLGLVASFPLVRMMGFWATLIILVAAFLVALLLFLETTLARLLGPVGGGANGIKLLWYRLRGLSVSDEEEDEEYEEEEETEEEEGENEEEEVESAPPRARPKKPFIETPAPVKFHRKIDIPIDLLSAAKSVPTSGDIKNNMFVIQKTLANFGIPVTMGEVSVGPTVTQFTLKPAEGVKLSKIVSLHSDLALALAAHPIRIEAPIPGKSLVGIEVPNQKIATVGLREILESPAFKKRESPMTIALGKDVSGRAWVADVARMPHLLVAGATGSGKSVCLNTIILSLLFQNSPDDLKFIMVDPKRVELPVYNGIPHLLTPVITDVTKTVNALKWAIMEMDRRLELLSQAGKRNIQSYNTVAGDNKLPYIIFMIDELADLMVTAAADIEGSIIRIAQMARAVGIHLILATQRPSVDVITGLIKANIPARIAFSVASLVDSRTILDSSGAEKLLGRGDMLHITAELPTPIRIQGAFVSDEEIKGIVDYLKERGEPAYAEGVTERPKAGSTTLFDYNGGDGDDLFEEAKEIVLSSGKASASFLQRRLKVGYARAARLLDLLEEAGVIGPGQGAKPREILMKAEEAGSEAEEANEESEEDASGEEDEEEDAEETEEVEEENAEDEEETDEKEET